MILDDLKERYIDPKTDFGFKYLFGTEVPVEVIVKYTGLTVEEIAKL